MSFSEPDNKEIMRALDKMQRQIDNLDNRLRENQKLLSPEHIAQVTGYVMVKNDTEQIKQALTEVLNWIKRH